ncbi:MAG: cation transporter dimerization domain-containing protein, partial [Alphaproteobacteria bacterium]
IEMHDLKTRLSGDCVFIQFCIHLDKKMTLDYAHHLTDKIEEAIIRYAPTAQVIIHIEPHLHEKSK